MKWNTNCRISVWTVATRGPVIAINLWSVVRTANYPLRHSSYPSTLSSQGFLTQPGLRADYRPRPEDQNHRKWVNVEEQHQTSKELKKCLREWRQVRWLWDLCVLLQCVVVYLCVLPPSAAAPAPSCGSLWPPPGLLSLLPVWPRPEERESGLGSQVKMRFRISGLVGCKILSDLAHGP